MSSSGAESARCADELCESTNTIHNGIPERGEGEASTLGVSALVSIYREWATVVTAVYDYTTRSIKRAQTQEQVIIYDKIKSGTVR